MMKINELRIGNWVKHPHDDTIKQIREIVKQGDLYCLTLDDCHDYTSILSLNSIPLTEEILLKCGFVKVYLPMFGAPLKFFSKANISVFLIANNKTEVQITDGVDDVNLAAKSPQYLHQLQNLYFDLTGKELEFKEKLARNPTSL